MQWGQTLSLFTPRCPWHCAGRESKRSPDIHPKISAFDLSTALVFHSYFCVQTFVCLILSLLGRYRDVCPTSNEPRESACNVFRCHRTSMRNVSYRFVSGSKREMRFFFHQGITHGDLLLQSKISFWISFIKMKIILTKMKEPIAKRNYGVIWSPVFNITSFIVFSYNQIYLINRIQCVLGVAKMGEKAS